MLPKPSLVLQVRLRPEEYSDTAAAEIKRSYMYLAQSVVSELDEGERAEGNLMRLNVRLMKPFGMRLTLLLNSCGALRSCPGLSTPRAICPQPCTTTTRCCIPWAPAT